MLNRIRRAIRGTRRRHALKRVHYRALKPTTIHGRAPHTSTLAGEDTALVRPYVLTATERTSWHPPVPTTRRATPEAH